MSGGIAPSAGWLTESESTVPQGLAPRSPALAGCRSHRRTARATISLMMEDPALEPLATKPPAVERPATPGSR